MSFPWNKLFFHNTSDLLEKKRSQQKIHGEPEKIFEYLVKIEDKCEYLIYQAFWYQFLSLS